MKSIVTLASIAAAGLLAVFAPLPSSAQTPSQPVLKVATITFNTAVLASAEAQREFSALKTKYAPRTAQLQSLNGEIENLQKQLQSGSTLSGTDRASRERDLSEKQRQLQRQADELKADSSADSQQLYARIAQKIYTFLQSYAPEHGYTMVIERGSDSNPIVWYANKSLDITSEVVKAYDARSGATTPAATKPGSAPK